MPEDKLIRDLQMRIALSEDMKAYKELYLLMFDSLFHFCCTFVKSEAVAQELVSDVFLKVWQIRNKLAGIDNLKPYLFGITKNFSLNYLAKESKNVSLSLTDLNIETMQLDSLIELKDPEALYISKEAVESILQAIRELPPQCQLIFYLVKVDGLKYKEVAKLLDVSVFTVRNHVATAVRKIEEAIPPGHHTRISFHNKFSAS